ncbi:hypothetical protein LTR29_016513 [Friedmanniomyces endolithicus]|nr:hypothetical protein LTR29_016513 [Friedmanniomyces endolithicus]
MADADLRPPPPGPSRWVLQAQAMFWRALMRIGMLLHFIAPPRPLKPSFTRRIPATVSGKPGWITLYFYTPPGWGPQRKSGHGRSEEDDGTEDTWKDISGGSRRTPRKWGEYPTVINFSGGGFTIGTATDDAR